MILRMWKGQSTAERAGEYIRHATRTVFPKLREIEGHRGAYLLRRPIKGGVEFIVRLCCKNSLATQDIVASPDSFPLQNLVKIFFATEPTRLLQVR
jgi:hypothetical protein